MKHRAIKYTLIILGLILILYLVYNWYSYRELRMIKSELNKLDNVEVTSINGLKDIILEEITAHLRIDNDKKLIIYGLKPDYQFEYDNSITIVQIGDYRFKSLRCEPISDCKGFVGFGTSLHFNKEEIFGYKFSHKIENVKDLINNYDEIKSILDTMPHFPEWKHNIGNTGIETFITIINNDEEKYLGQFDALYKTQSFEELKNILPWSDTCCRK